MQLAVGIDLGGTLIKYALVDRDGKIVSFRTHSTDAGTSREQVMKNLEYCIDDSLKAARLLNSDVYGIGVGIPGVVEEEKTNENLTFQLSSLFLFKISM